jgi:hypothetical protein
MAVWPVFNLGDLTDTVENLMKNTFLVLVALVAFGFRAVAALSNNPIINVYDTVGPIVSHTSFPAFANAAVKLVKDTGTLPTGVKTNLADPKLATYVAATNFVNGSTVWSFVELKARNAGETVSLSQIMFVSRSLDSANSLGKTNVFTTRDYTETAIGIRADGRVITSGPSSQECVRVIVGIGWKSYVANTPTQVQEVIDYIAQFPNWGINPFVSAGSATFSKTLTLVDPTTPAEKPILSIAMVSGVPNLVVGHSANHTMTYEIQRSGNLGGTFTTFTNVMAGMSYPLTGEATVSFFRHKP